MKHFHWEPLVPVDPRYQPSSNRCRLVTVSRVRQRRRLCCMPLSISPFRRIRSQRKFQSCRWVQPFQDQEVRHRQEGRIRSRKVSSAMKRSKEMCLSAFFTVKTHKIGNPFRVMVSEVGTWQKCLGSYLLEGLRQLPINDPFLVRNSTEVTSS